MAIRQASAADITQIVRSEMSTLFKNFQEAVTATLTHHYHVCSKTSANFVPSPCQVVHRHGEHNPLNAQPSTSRREQEPSSQALKTIAKPQQEGLPLPPTLYIPRPPRHKKGEVSITWQRAIKDWNEASPTNPYPLKDWLKHWYTGKNRTRFGQAYFN
jgi:hypothetical protein